MRDKIFEDVPLIAPREELNFLHQDSCTISNSLTAYDAYCAMSVESPLLLKAAFWIRDRLSALGGVKPIKDFSHAYPQRAPQPGEKLDFFDVVSIDDDELCLTACDSHLSVMVAIQRKSIEGKTQQKRLMLTTSVKTHNRFGTLYMLPVAPAHNIIVRTMFNRIAL